MGIKNRRIGRFRPELHEEVNKLEEKSLNPTKVFVMVKPRGKFTERMEHTRMEVLTLLLLVLVLTFRN